jgi:predicted DNA-binding transcriptional regulator AlpA|tara:strand:- start:147 stop:284 length:138 start_codon:yes stop_codon:yes gene_type:complete
MKNNPEFPKKISLGGRAIGFNVDEVDTFVAKIIEHGSIWWLKNED